MNAATTFLAIPILSQLYIDAHRTLTHVDP